MTGIELIAIERLRQINDEEYTAAHDDEHEAGEIAMAAACYAAPRRLFELNDYADQGHLEFVDPWPFESSADKRSWRPSGVTHGEDLLPAQRIDLLVKAGALIAAEIDRLLRTARPKGKHRKRKP